MLKSAPCISSADRVLLGTSASLGEIRSAMTRMMSVSLSRVKCCRGPMVRTLVLLFFMGQPSPAMALTGVARMPSRAVTGLQRAHAKFFVTSETRPPFMGLSTVEAGIPVAIYPSPNTREGLTPHDLLTRAALLAVMPCLLTVGMKGADHSDFSTLDIPVYLEGAPEYNLLNTSNLYTRLSLDCINQLSAYACFAFPHGEVPRAAERFPRLLGGSMCKAPSKIFPWRTAMMSLLFLAPVSSTVRVGAFVFANLGYAEATVCPHCKDTILPAAHVATACPLVAELTNNAAIFTTKKLGSSPTVAHSLTHELAAQFTRPVIDAIVGLACAPVNGKHDDSSKKPCADFNGGRPCRTLKADGSCVFAHKCNQFVSDKGPLGYCFKLLWPSCSVQRLHLRRRQEAQVAS